MEINVHTKKLVPKEKLNLIINEQTKTSTVERLERALKKHADFIESVDVHYEDESTASHKFDGRCRIQVHPQRGSVISIDAHGESFPELLSNATNKIQHAMDHLNEKRTSRRKHQDSTED